MTFASINPATGVLLQHYPALDETCLEQALGQTAEASPAWQATTLAERGALLLRLAGELRNHAESCAALISREMGKPIREARAEIEKCVWGCEFYAANAERFLQDEPVATDAGRSYVVYRPLGTVLAIMPWNFPFWQMFRFAAPALMAGNCVLLKHAPNVPGCAEALARLFGQAGFPAGVFQSLRISHEQAERILADPRIHAVTLTGSARAGRRIAALAGAALKKAVLELGGSDPFIVLADADLEAAATEAVAARFQNCGQSCIAAKRFILPDGIAEEFLSLFKEKAARLRVGDPLSEDTQLGPMARADLRDQLQRQVAESIRQGAVPLLGCAPSEGLGFFYPASLLDRTGPGMPAHDEELFGPVAAIVRVRDEAEALRAANAHRYGLGGSVWTRDSERGEHYVRRLDCGVAFVNGMVRSDPRMPFGGVKDSGFGRELGTAGIREFTNIKSVWIARG
jgi:succinate-semialdehyde dehydrogenase/glutarate-semialdehyde dehydrogenase